MSCQALSKIDELIGATTERIGSGEIDPVTGAGLLSPIRSSPRGWSRGATLMDEVTELRLLLPPNGV